MGWRRLAQYVREEWPRPLYLLLRSAGRDIHEHKPAGACGHPNLPRSCQHSKPSLACIAVSQILTCHSAAVAVADTSSTNPVRRDNQGKTATKIAKIPRLLKKWKGKEAELIAEVRYIILVAAKRFRHFSRSTSVDNRVSPPLMRSHLLLTLMPLELHSSAKYKMNEISTMGSWRQLLRKLCPANVAAMFGAQHAEAVGLTVLVVACTTAIYLYSNTRGRDSQHHEGQGKTSDPDEIDLWSGDEEREDLTD